MIFSCSYVLGSGGNVMSCGESEMAETVKGVIEPMASDGLRTIGLAYKDFVPTKSAENEVL